MRRRRRGRRPPSAQVALAVDGVRGTHKCRVRRSGVTLLVDLDIIVDGHMTVQQGHALAHRVKAALLACDLGILDVVVHVEPDDDGWDRSAG